MDGRKGMRPSGPYTSAMRSPVVDRLDLPLDAGEESNREAAIVLIAATVLLLVFSYWGRPGFYTRSGLLSWASDAVGGPLSRYPGVGAYLWWGATSVALRVLAPLAIIVFVLRRRPGEFGFRVRGSCVHARPYLLLYLAMVPLLVWVSGFESFGDFYPFYDRAGESATAYWLYTGGYALQFVGVEAFFRGFMTFGLARRFGLLAVPIMTIPYTMIHFSKPMPEATAAIAAGLILGYMALRSKSFVPGIFLHVAVAITMDLLVLGRAGLLGNLW